MDIVLSPDEKRRLAQLDRDPRWVVDASLIAHLCDQYRWGLIEANDARTAIERIVHTLAHEYKIDAPDIKQVCATALPELMILAVVKET